MKKYIFLIILIATINLDLSAGEEKQFKEYISKSYKGYKFVERTDHTGVISNDDALRDLWENHFYLDYNQDGVKDHVVYLINTSAKHAFIAVFYKDKKEGYRAEIIKDLRWTEKDYKGLWVKMYIKQKGEGGIAGGEAKYFNTADAKYPYLDYEEVPKDVRNKYNSEVKKYINSVAVEMNSGNIESSEDIEDLFYCFEGYYFDRGRTKKASVCD